MRYKIYDKVVWHGEKCIIAHTAEDMPERERSLRIIIEFSTFDRGWDKSNEPNRLKNYVSSGNDKYYWVDENLLQYVRPQHNIFN